MLQIPKIVIAGLVSNKSYVGSVDTSSFNFKDYDMSEMTLTWTTDTVEYRTVPYSFLTDSNPKVPESHLLAVESLRSTAADPNLGNGIDRDNYRRQGKFHHYFLIYNNVFRILGWIKQHFIIFRLRPNGVPTASHQWKCFEC